MFFFRLEMRLLEMRPYGNAAIAVSLDTIGEGREADRVMLLEGRRLFDPTPGSRTLEG